MNNLARRSAIVATMLDPKQRHRLLLADQTDVTWIAAAIERLMAADPDVTLDEIGDVLRAAASTAYVIADGARS